MNGIKERKEKRPLAANIVERDDFIKALRAAIIVRDIARDVPAVIRDGKHKRWLNR